MPIIAKMKEKIDERKQKILLLVNDNNKSHLLPSLKEIMDMDEIDIESIIREREEREKRSGRGIPKTIKNGWFLI